MLSAAADAGCVEAVEKPKSTFTDYNFERIGRLFLRKTRFRKGHADFFYSLVRRQTDWSHPWTEIDSAPLSVTS
jgi:hypothetical protein